MRRYREEHREEIRAYHHEWYLKSVLNGTFKYSTPTPEKQRENSKRYYDKHKHEEAFKQMHRDANRAWREKNREKWNAYYREYRKRKALEVQI